MNFSQRTKSNKPGSFEEKLAEHGYAQLCRENIDILQVNIGKMCNQVCVHCHVDAGPHRKEIMTKETMSWCIEALRKNPTFKTVDITGGAPELNPGFRWLAEEITQLNREIIVRSNLTILVSNNNYRSYPEFFAKNKITIISSLPCYSAENVNKQRGRGVFEKSIEALRLLNQEGYGKDNSGLLLHLVYNPVGPHLPPPQKKLEAQYRQILSEEFGIVFNNLYTITNMPINRFDDLLQKSDNKQSYMQQLADSFNPSTIGGLMCRNTLSVGWDGKLYDCDFNQMLDLVVKDISIRDFALKKLSDRKIITGDHCYGCTAGCGSSCQGSIV